MWVSGGRVFWVFGATLLLVVAGCMGVFVCFEVFSGGFLRLVCGWRGGSFNRGGSFLCCLFCLYVLGVLGRVLMSCVCMVWWLFLVFWFVSRMWFGPYCFYYFDLMFLCDVCAFICYFEGALFNSWLVVAFHLFVVWWIYTF